MTKIYTLLFICFTFYYSKAQTYKQYFDGADTSYSNSIIAIIDTSTLNIWQIGKPQKTIFNNAASAPNAIVTDTIDTYPANNISRFTIKITPMLHWGVLAIQWMQKLDMKSNTDGGIIEFSTDKGSSWQNAFNNPYVYNFYGFQQPNQVTLNTGEQAFSGSDSTWRNIWLCFDMSWMGMTTDTVLCRFTFKSDSSNAKQEGWMIDNMISHPTMVHTLKIVSQPKYLNVYPNPTADIIHIEAQKLPQFHIIEKMELMNEKGEVIDQWKNCPTKFFIDAHKYTNGNYYLKVKTNIKEETIPIVIAKA